MIVGPPGEPAIMYTRGNHDCHIILRGGQERPNYDSAGIANALALLRAARSHGVQLIIPVSDDVLLPLSDARERFAGVCALALPDRAALSCVTDKRATLDLARRLGVPVPATRVEDLGPNGVRIVATAEAPSYVILDDFYHRGWTARVDGQPVRVFIANALFRAVAIEPGTHTIEFRFEPLSHLIGLAISAASLLVALLVIGWGLRSK